MGKYWDTVLKDFFTSTLPDEVKREVVDFELNQRGREDICVYSYEILGIPLNNFQRKFLTYSTTPRSLWGEKFGIEIEDIGGYLFGRNIACPSNQSGKGLKHNERVLSLGGWKEVGKLKVGDEVYSQDGTLTRVKGVFPQGKVPLYKFIFDDGASVIVDGQHRWSVLTPVNRFSKSFNEMKRFGKIYPNENFGKYEVMNTTELLARFGANPKPWQRVAIPVVEPIQFPYQKVSIDPYLLGLLLGDGSFSKGNVRFYGEDPELHKAFGSFAKKIISQKGKATASRIELDDPLKKMGLIGHRSWEKFVLKEYLWNSVGIRLAVLQGLMDTDGSIYGRGTMEYTTTSPQLAEGVKFLVQSLGG
ncbi:MAG: hypothetical protein DDT40_01183 [candidate division WS2 bacterium]|nr:hypothetical protein [Candidatus Psychracetigena formicireducens]